MTEVTHVVINGCLLLSSLLISEARLPETYQSMSTFSLSW